MGLIRVISIINRKQANALFKKLSEVERKLERANLAEFMQLLQRPARLIFLNFLGGLARGFGIAIGLTIIASLFILILTRLASLNLPVIGAYIAELVKIVNQHLKLYS
ncbi:MAG TPA: hypothetical protein DDW50_10855 [Firmicutes bacterium]|nr:hypothetical protein [Bacillota bacterium]